MEKETLLQFPCLFPLKVVGHNIDSLEMTILDIIKKHFADISKIAITSRYSKDNKYRAFTLQLTPTSQQQLDAIYQELTSCPDIVMVL